MFTFVLQFFDMNISTLKNLFKLNKEVHLFGRYICGEHILPLLEKHDKNFKVETIGSSVLGERIHAITIGKGSKKILMWSQMHGNESTTTKAIFDLCNVFADSDDPQIADILNNCTIAIIPMLNPDGAKSYVRFNANEVDLNRDAQDCSQPESVALRTYFDKFKPDVCFNLHGQRTIFSAGNANHPATVSFLSPAQDADCLITENRKKAMEIIVKMNENLQAQIPNQVGIYDDAFNLNCVGDTFQSKNVPTILFEAGHYINDYNREEVRELIFQSLMIAIHHISSQTLTGMNYEDYLKIPQNQKLYFDIIIRNAKVNSENCDVAIQYQEKLVEKVIHFVPIIEKLSDLEGFFGHKEIDAKGAVVLNSKNKKIEVGNEIDFVMINNEKIMLMF